MPDTTEWAKRFSKLPKWAQDHIEMLDRNLQYVEGKLEKMTSGENPSATAFVRKLGGDWSDYVPLSYNHVVFAFPGTDLQEAHLDCHMEDFFDGPALVVSASGLGAHRLDIEPSASNVIKVRTRRD